MVWACEGPAGQSIAIRTAKIQADRFIGEIPRAEYFIVLFALRDNIRLPAPAYNALRSWERRRHAGPGPRSRRGLRGRQTPTLHKNREGWGTRAFKLERGRSGIDTGRWPGYGRVQGLGCNRNFRLK